jgi:hypothetical protein
VIIAFGHDEQEARLGGQREAGFGGGGDQIEIDTDGAHDDGVSRGRARDVALA